MPPVFIALQCCQCSTMQVKQQKKSSNKWTCVVCNQKQSVRKVYAQGFMAKDVRQFVQNFNMSRQLAEQDLPNIDAQTEALEIGDQGPCNGKQKRTDWTEYMATEEDSSNAPFSLGENDGDEFEPKIITELPKPLFKKPKVKNYRIADDDEQTSLGKIGGKHTRSNISSYAVESNRYQNAMFRGTQGERTDHAAKRKHTDMLEGMKLEQPRKLQSSKAKEPSASKWSCYMTEEEEEEEEEGGDLRNQVDEFNHQNAFETELKDQRVEEDIHPDFV